MKTNLAYLLWLLPLGACDKTAAVAPQPAGGFASPAAAKAYFYDLEARHGRALLAHDTAFFERYYAPGFNNCTPTGELRDRAAEISGLLAETWVSVEPIAPQLDCFGYNGSLAMLATTNRVTVQTPAGAQQQQRLRVVTVFQRQAADWQAISGQATLAVPHLAGE